MTDRASARISVRDPADMLPPKPHDFDSEEAKASGAVVIISLVTGLCGTISLFFAQSVKADDFYLFAEYILRVMDQPSYMVTLTQGAFFSSLALFLSSFVLSIGALLINRRIMLAALAGVFVSAGFVLAGGAIVLSYTSGLNSDINTGGTVLEGPARELQDFSIAMYDECCVAAGYIDSDAAIIGKFSDLEADDERWSELPDCPTFYQDNFDDEFALLAESCVGSQLHVQWFELAVTDYVCSTLNSTTVNIAGQKLGSIDITGFTKGTEKIIIAGEAREPIYGCGGGKIKTFQFINYLWFQTTVEPVGIAMVVLGVISVLLALLGVATTGINSGADSEINMLVLSAYMDQQEAALAAEERRQEQRLSVQRPATRPPPTAAVVKSADSQFEDVDDKI